MALRTGLGLLVAAIALGAAAQGAQGEAVVPPGNSAATQYTEAIPTAGGPTTTGKHGGRKPSPPSHVLGSHNTAKLNAQGPQGKATAEVAAQTAPAPVAPAGGTEPSGGGRALAAGGQDGSGHGNVAPSNQTPAPNAGKPAPGSSATTAASSSPGGSSAFGEVVGQATGSSDSGRLGLFLPLLIVAVVVGSIVYLTRQRKRPAG